MPRIFQKSFKVYVEDTGKYKKLTVQLIPDKKHQHGWHLAVQIPPGFVDTFDQASKSVTTTLREFLRTHNTGSKRVAWISAKTRADLGYLEDFSKFAIRRPMKNNRYYPRQPKGVRTRIKQFVEGRRSRHKPRLNETRNATHVKIQWDHSSNGQYTAWFEIDENEYHVSAWGPSDGGGRVSLSFHTGRWMSENAMNGFDDPAVFAALLECARLIVAKQMPYKLYIGTDYYPADVSKQSRPIREELARILADENVGKVLTRVREYRDWSVQPKPGQKLPMARSIEYCVKFPRDIGAGIR